jgi:protein phosphatase
MPLQTLQCDCGTVLGTTWLAVITGPTSLPPVLPSVPPFYLDAHQRYQVLSPLQPFPPGLAGFVLDCQPWQPAPLRALFDAVMLKDAPIDPAAALAAARIPPIVQAYLSLPLPLVPPIHDAWCEGDQEILLLADRSTLPWLSDALSAPETSLDQILGWLNVMLDLWSKLAPWHCCQSLLMGQNLHLADGELQLHCLQPDIAPPSLAQLGAVWVTWLGDHPVVPASSLLRLLHDLQTGQIELIEDLRSRLARLSAHRAKSPTGVAPVKALRYPIPSVNFNQTDSSSIMMSDPPATPAMPADFPSDPVPTNAEAPSPVDATQPDQTSEITPKPMANVPSNGPEIALETAPEIVGETSAANVPTVLESDRENDGSDDMPTIVLPMQLFSLEDAGRTDIGRQREHNEDNYGIETQVIRSEQPTGKSVRARGLYILCDGMGGHAGGEVASALAVDTLKQYFQSYWQNTPLVGALGQATSQLPPTEVIRDAIQQANKAIYDVNQQAARSGSGRMGTTLVVALLHDTEVAIAHVGDSRLYRYTRKYGLEQLTVDHEVGQREIQRGVEAAIAYGRPDAYQLTQALGPRSEDFIQPDIQFLELNEDTLLLIASDGLTDNDLLETYCETHIDPMMSSQMNLDKGVSQLIDLANQYNGHDNITAIAIRAKVRPNLDHLR